MSDKKAVVMQELPDAEQELLVSMQQSMVLEWWDPTTLAPNDLNWKKHPTVQRKALNAFMAELEERTGDAEKQKKGAPWVGALLYNKRTSRLLDGHMRQTEAIERGDPFVPVLVVDVAEEVENVILRYLDQIGSMYAQDEDALALLEQQVNVDAQILQQLLGDGAVEEEGEEGEEEEGKEKKRSDLPPGGLALSLGQKFDYVVLLFKTDVDWNAAQDHFNLQRQRCPFGTSIGLGRVVDGAKYLHRVRLMSSGVPLDDVDDTSALLAENT